MKSILSDHSLMDAIANSVIRDKDGQDSHLPEGFRLPELDNEKLSKFADGAIDGIFIYHTDHQPISEEARDVLIKAMKAVGKGNRDEAKKLFEELGTQARAISIIDDLQQYILSHKESVSVDSVVKFALYTLYNTQDRESLKFALSMLELVRLDDDSLKETLRILGLSDEFTLFVIFIMQQWENANEEIFRLARKTTGWGRIHAIERLIPDTPEIREWLLREGVHNSVLPAYSALNCWEGSEAENLLFSSDLSPENFSYISGLISALLDEGPCPGISEIEKGEEVIKAYLRKAKEMPADCIDGAVLDRIKEHFTGVDGEITSLVSQIIFR
ncbi:MAG: hypothetical protein IJM51_02080 [Clostridia bacterium]|nr:hypothetical protein [Clostridia bacterium]